MNPYAVLVKPEVKWITLQAKGDQVQAIGWRGDGPGDTDYIERFPRDFKTLRDLTEYLERAGFEYRPPSMLQARSTMYIFGEAMMDYARPGVQP